MNGIGNMRDVPDQSSSRNPAEDYGIITRWVLFLVGLSTMTVGIAISVHAVLGTSPISTVPAALAAATPLSLGTITVIMNLIFVVAQLLLLRRDFRLFNLLQIAVAFFFGAMCDVSLALTNSMVPHNYFEQWLMVVLGAVLVALGVFLEVLPRLLYVPGEGVVAAIAKVSGWKFGTVKQCFDWSLVIIAAALSLILLGELVGVREGTVFAAFAVGGFVKIFQRIYDSLVNLRA